MVWVLRNFTGGLSATALVYTGGEKKITMCSVMRILRLATIGPRMHTHMVSSACKLHLYARVKRHSTQIDMHQEEVVHQYIKGYSCVRVFEFS